MKNPFYHHSEVIQKMRQGWRLSWHYCQGSPTRISDFFLTNPDLRDFQFVKVHKKIAHTLLTRELVVEIPTPDRWVRIYYLRSYFTGSVG